MGLRFNTLHYLVGKHTTESVHTKCKKLDTFYINISEFMALKGYIIRNTETSIYFIVNVASIAIHMNRRTNNKKMLFT